MRTNMAKQWLVTVASYYVLCSLALTMANGAEEGRLKTCDLQTVSECPPNSLCTRINSTKPEDLKCICLQNFQLNPNWLEPENATAAQGNYCIPPSPEAEQNKVVVYMRSASNPQHLAFGIIMVLLAVTLVTAALYGLKALRPIKRTKAAYKRLKNRRRNITPLQEMDELDMNRRYEMETYSIQM